MEQPARSFDLQDYDKDLWKKESIDLTIADGDLAHQTFYCDVLQSVASQTNHKISFTLNTRAYLPVEIDIPFYSSAKGRLALMVDGKNIENFEVEATDIDKPRVTHITAQITPWTEKERRSILELRFKSEIKNKITLILECNELSLAPGTIQRWDFSYFVRAILFFVFANSIVLGLGILLAAQLRGINSSLQFYAFIGTTIGVIFGALGVTDLLKIPFREKIRLFYSKTYKNRLIWLACLGVLFLIVYTGVGIVAYSIWMRSAYTDLIKKALANTNDTASPVKAFKMMPWRKEAQSIIEAQINSVRDQENIKYLNLVRAFTEDPQIIRTIENYSDKALPFYQTGDTTTLNNPSTWFAGLSIEKEEDIDGKKIAIDKTIEKLSKREDYESQIFKLNLELENLIQELGPTKDDTPEQKSVFSRMDECLSQLEGIVADIDNSNNLELINSFYYQMACDTIANHYANLCVYKEYIQGPCSQKIFNYFNKEIQVRFTSLDSNPLWIRQPEKLVLYHLFIVENPTESDEGKETGECLKMTLAYIFCKGIGDFPNDSSCLRYDMGCYENGGKKSVIDNYSKEFQSSVWWRKGTSSFKDTNFKNNVTALLDKGWRY